MEFLVSLSALILFSVIFGPDLIRRIKRKAADKEADKRFWVLEKKFLVYIGRFLPKESAQYLRSAIYENEAGGRERLGYLLDAVFRAVCEKCIREYAKVLIRKRNSSIFKDDYGRIIRGKWDGEVAYFVETVLIPFVVSEDEKYPALCIGLGNSYGLFVRFYDRNGCLEYYTILIEMVLDSLAYEGGEDESLMLPESGHDYERYVAAIFEKHGYPARVTKGSGDHGADIVVDWGGGEIVVQCKHYSSPVGNKAVQEAYSAKGFYGADQAWVVASSSFTPAAKIAAERLGVLLFHHEDLPEMLEAIDSGNV